MVFVSDAVRWPVLNCPRMAGFEVSIEAGEFPRSPAWSLYGYQAHPTPDVQEALRNRSMLIVALMRWAGAVN